MVLQTEKRYYTPEEYLELEEKAEYKNEYRDGEIISSHNAKNSSRSAFQVVANASRNL